MNIKGIGIEKCGDCPFIGSTGSYTKGGAKPCCGHKKTIEKFGNNCFKRIIPYKNDYKDLDLIGNPIKNIKKIPEWCPLDNVKILQDKNIITEKQ